MFDSIPVKYSSWSREKNLDGIIKGTGYLCSCADCNHSKRLNAYEFERHACAKTKHPNNRIYFENGKTIHAVVEELKNTPQDMLFDAIQNVTGSQVNKKNFRVWIASFQAASVTISVFMEMKLLYHLEMRIFLILLMFWGRLRFDPWIASLVVNYRVEFGHIWILNFW
ncbi:hypothetical protein ABKV19_013204, partial [Rosa sericea]